MKRLFLWITFAALILTACDHRKKAKETWLTLSPLPAQCELPYFLLIEDGRNVQVDTLVIKEGKTTLQLLPDTVGIAHLFNRKNEKICSFYAHEKAQISLTKVGEDYSFEGDSINKLLFAYYRSVEPMHKAKGKTLKRIGELLGRVTKDSIRILISDPKLHTQDSLFRIRTEQFIAANKNLPTALIAFDHYNEQSILTPAAYSWLQPVSGDLLKHPVFRDRIALSERSSSLAINATLSFSSFVDLKGKLYSESKKKRNRIVCFWDPNDSISVATNKYLAKKFARKGEKRYRYFGISLNGNTETLEQCFKKEKIGGIQLMTEGDNSQAKRNEYGISATPYIVLIDTNLRVIDAGMNIINKR